MSSVHVVGAAIFRGDTCLVAQRGPGMRLPGKWEFPGGKVELGETPSAALVREIMEELGLMIGVGELLATGTAEDGSKRLHLDVYAAAVTGGSLILREHARIAWATVGDLPTFDWAEADVPIVPAAVSFLCRRTRVTPT